LASAEWGGPLGRPAGRPYTGKALFSEKDRFARPSQETRCASWFLRAMPLLPGRVCPEVQSSLHLLGKNWRRATSLFLL